MAINGTEIGKPRMSMLEACAAYGVETFTSPEEKDRIRNRVIAGWPFSPAERAEILHMCTCDVLEEEGLLRALPATARSFFAVHRGDFVKAIARAWFRGVPIGPRFATLTQQRDTRLSLREEIIGSLEDRFPVWDGLTLKNHKLAEVFAAHGYPLPAAGESGRAVSEQAALRRIIGDSGPLVELVDGLHTLGQLRDFALPIGADHRLRAWFAPLWTATSRSAPATNEYIFNLPAWLRGAMEAPEGYALIYADWSAMEFGIAGARAGDPVMMEFYHQDCPYIACSVAFGLLPADATRQSHPVEREFYKPGILATQYKTGPETLARTIKRSEVEARAMIAGHHKTFRRYWEWSDGVVANLISTGLYRSPLGWECRVMPRCAKPGDRLFNEQQLRNRDIQTVGADVLRVACIFMDQLEVGLLATAHDATLSIAPLAELDRHVKLIEICMRQAGELLLNGFRLKVKTTVLRPGDRWIEDRGRSTFEIVDRFLRGMDEAHG
jgi:DNA polymerase I